MPDYKFLHSTHMNNILVDGTVRTSSVEYYRSLEATQPGIADPYEASIRETYTNFTKTRDTPDRFASIFQVAPGGEVQLHGVVIHHRPPGDLFIFCASRGDLSSLRRDMCADPRTPDDHPYDACIRILDMSWLAHRMFHRGTVVAPAELRGVKVSRVFKDFRVAAVAYDNLLVEIDNTTTTTPPPLPSPFKKHYEFAKQREVRIALQPRGELPYETLIIKIPHPEQIFVEEFRALCNTAGGMSGN